MRFQGSLSKDYLRLLKEILEKCFFVGIDKLRISVKTAYNMLGIKGSLGFGDVGF